MNQTIDIPTQFSEHPLLEKQAFHYPPLCGTVACFCIPVTFREHPFDSAERLQFTSAFTQAKSLIESRAKKAGVRLEITPYILSEIFVEKACFNKRELIDDALTQLLNRYECKSVTSLKYLMKLKLFSRHIRADAIDILFISPLTNAVSQAISYYSHLGPGAENYCCIYKDPDYSSETIQHELLHLHGAVDLYPPQYLHIASSVLGSSIMECNSTRIDPFTSYLIGWTELDGCVAEFLTKTS